MSTHQTGGLLTCWEHKIHPQSTAIQSLLNTLQHTEHSYYTICNIWAWIHPTKVSSSPAGNTQHTEIQLLCNTYTTKVGYAPAWNTQYTPNTLQYSQNTIHDMCAWVNTTKVGSLPDGNTHNTLNVLQYSHYTIYDFWNPNAHNTHITHEE